MKNIFLILFIQSISTFVPTPQVAHTLNQAYNNFWDGAVGGLGYWGDTPKGKQNVFSSSFDKKGINNIYDMNSLSPYASQRSSHFDSMVPYYTPNGASTYNFVPTKSNYLSNNQLGSFSYDINEPRYQQLYKEYYDFYNTNLDRISKIDNYERDYNNINNNHIRKVKNPKSFEYDHYFDKRDELNSMFGPNLPKIQHKVNRSYARKLKQIEKKEQLIGEIQKDLNVLKKHNEIAKKKQERKLKQKKKQERKLRQKKKLLKKINNDLKVLAQNGIQKIELDNDLNINDLKKELIQFTQQIMFQIIAFVIVSIFCQLNEDEQELSFSNQNYYFPFSLEDNGIDFYEKIFLEVLNRLPYFNKHDSDKFCWDFQKPECKLFENEFLNEAKNPKNFTYQLDEKDQQFLNSFLKSGLNYENDQVLYKIGLYAILEIFKKQRQYKLVAQFDNDCKNSTIFLPKQDPQQIVKTFVYEFINQTTFLALKKIIQIFKFRFINFQVPSIGLMKTFKSNNLYDSIQQKELMLLNDIIFPQTQFDFKKQFFQGNSMQENQTIDQFDPNGFYPDESFILTGDKQGEIHSLDDPIIQFHIKSLKPANTKIELYDNQENLIDEITIGFKQDWYLISIDPQQKIIKIIIPSHQAIDAIVVQRISTNYYDIISQEFDYD